jgi:hypothetical protein
MIGLVIATNLAQERLVELKHDLAQFRGCRIRFPRWRLGRPQPSVRLVESYQDRTILSLVIHRRGH